MGAAQEKENFGSDTGKLTAYQMSQRNAHAWETGIVTREFLSVPILPETVNLSLCDL